MGDTSFAFLVHTLGALTRLLPHVETYAWTLQPRAGHTRAASTDQTRRELSLELTLELPARTWCLCGRLQRRRVPQGIGAIARTMDTREQDIADCVLSLIRDVFLATQSERQLALSAIRSEFDARVVARHLCKHFDLKSDLADWFGHLRQLAEQSYESKSLVFGCVIDALDSTWPDAGSMFPDDYLAKKKYRALSDGYRTAYLVSSRGGMLGYVRLEAQASNAHGYLPEWCRDLADYCEGSRIGFCLTRQGDILIFDQRRLTFSYRFGRWQYWNHSHIVDLMRNAARVQRVSPSDVAAIVRSLYRVALDISFRHSGGLFVLLRNRNALREMVRKGDAIGDRKRDEIDAAFDAVASSRRVTTIPRSIMCDLAALDGAVVLNNAGAILAYAAVLEPRKRKGVVRAEGSRTKAAIGASNYGMAIKVSSDGEMTLFVGGKKLIQV